MNMLPLAISAVGGVSGLWGAGRIVAAFDDARIAETYSRSLSRSDVAVGIAWLGASVAFFTLAWALQ